MLVAVCSVFVPSASAQYYFGKNKVQYSRFDWRMMTTQHFKVYFYKEETNVARVAANLAEEAYRSVAIKFNQEVKDKIPLILYSAPAYFSQTNVIPGLLPESVAGFTEFMKGRVVVPFDGSFFDLDHVIRHEIVHVFQLAKLEAVTDRIPAQKVAYPPLWFTEGQAEFWSEDWDTEADMIVKDMVLSGKLPPIESFYAYEGSFFVYKLGQSVCAFIDSTYGSDKLTRIYDNWYRGRSFEEVVKFTLGEDIKEVSRKWEYALKRKYYPQVEKHGLPSMESDQITADGFNLKGVPIEWNGNSEDTTWIVYMSYRRGYAGLYLKPASKSQHDDITLLKGERSAKFESLHLLHSGIDVNDSGLVVFSSKSRERDVIYLLDIRRREVLWEFAFPDLVAARSPQFSPDGKQIVFSGTAKNGFCDVYLLDPVSGSHKKLTDDIYYDTDPTFTLDGRQVIFSSDRSSEGQRGALNLFSLDLASGAQRQLTFGNFRDQTPEATARGIYFSSTREGSYNLFLLDTAGNLTQQSSYVTAAFDPRISHDGKTLFYTGYQNLGFQVYRMKILDSVPVVPMAFETEAPRWKPSEISKDISQTSIAYDTKYSFDIAQSSVSYDAIYGSLGGLQAAISDVLGDKAYYFLLANTAQTRSEFLSSFNFGVTFVNRERRLNWGVGVFHLYDEYYNDYEGYYFERQAGVAGLFSYPLSKFNRVDFATYARYDKKDLQYGLKPREGFLVSNSLSWVYDNAIWDISGPIEGRRYNLTLGLTTSLTDGRVYNKLASVDIRHYFRLGQASAIANRLWAYTSAGLDPQRLYFGGSWSFRGFGRRAFYNRNILFASTELRFPFINDLLIGFPIGDLGFRAIRGALFYDNGAAWDDHFDQFYGSFGAGIRVNLGYVILLRFDFSRTTDYHTISNSTRFDFFFGWNF